MSVVIAVAGKGGVGKSTISALLVEILSRQGSVLAVDADPNSNLGIKLGVDVPGTIGEVREGLLTKQGELPRDMSKQEYLTIKLRRILAEADRFDMLTLGRPEGPGCYCYVNNLLRVFVDKLMDDYDAVVIDNEAGMEHLSRRTSRKMDLLVLVADPTQVGVATARRLSDLADELKLNVGRKLLLINGVRKGDEERASSLVTSSGLPFFILHEDEKVRLSSMEGTALHGDEALASEIREILPDLFPSSRRRAG